MMNKQILTFYLVILCISGMSSQSEMLLVLYDTKSAYSVENNLSEEEKKVPWKVEHAKKLKRDMESLEYSLIIDKNRSEFELVARLRFSDYQSNSFAFVDGGRSYYVDENQFIERLNYYGEDILIVEKANAFDWKLTDISKEILGYTCFLATSKKEGQFPAKIDAWYAPELPFFFGPKGYHGLPGLIMEVVLNDILTHTATSLEFNADVLVVKPTNGKIKTRSEFDAEVQSTISFMKSYYRN